MSQDEGDHPAAGDSGWRPDPENPGNQRYWGGERWTGLVATSTTGATGADATEPDATEAADEPATTSRPAVPRWLNIALGVALALVAVFALLLVLNRGDDEPASTGSPPTNQEPDASGDGTETDDIDTDIAIETDTDGPTDPDATPGPDAPPAPSPGPGGSESELVAPCEVDAGTLVAALEAHPPLEPFIGQLNLADIRCAGGWATATVWATDTDFALGVFRADGDSWELILLGDSEPCAGLGIPGPTEQLLGCDFNPPATGQ